MNSKVSQMIIHANNDPFVRRHKDMTFQVNYVLHYIFIEAFPLSFYFQMKTIYKIELTDVFQLNV